MIKYVANIFPTLSNHFTEWIFHFFEFFSKMAATIFFYVPPNGISDGLLLDLFD